MKRQKTFVGRMSTTLMTAKMTCRTRQRTGATLAVRTEISVTWWTAWSRTSCVHSWQLIALSGRMRGHFGVRPRRVCRFLQTRTGASTRCACGKGRAQLSTKIGIGDQETTGARRKDVSKTDNKHTKGKDQPKGAGIRTYFRTRAPFNREARIVQAMDDDAGMCTGKCFKFVP